MADFVDCDFKDTEPANESFDIFENDEPPAKKRRGANVKYEFVEEVESSDDLKQKANVAGVTKISKIMLIICNHRQWPNMPALRQTINGTARNRQGRPRNHATALSRT
uniref:Uncharacterized protein n=1 Tax=Panagrolaimus davidi TaxID=227884 RepID=A0A914QF89_9BILA